MQSGYFLFFDAFQNCFLSFFDYEGQKKSFCHRKTACLKDDS